MILKKTGSSQAQSIRISRGWNQGKWITTITRAAWCHKISTLNNKENRELYKAEQESKSRAHPGGLMWLGELWPPKEGSETADVQKGSEFKTKVSETLHCTFNHTHLNEQKRKGGDGKNTLFQVCLEQGREATFVNDPRWVSTWPA